VNAKEGRRGRIIFLAAFAAVLLVRPDAAAVSGEDPDNGPYRFSLRIGGGLGFLPGRGGDLELLRHHVEYGYTSRSSAVRAEFDWNPMSSGGDFPLELVVRLKPYLALGLGTGLFRSAVHASYTKDYESTITVSGDSMIDDNHYENTRDIMIRLIPVRINLYLFFPLGRLSIYSYGGLGWYWGKLTHLATAYTEIKSEFRSSTGYSSKDEDDDERTIEEDAGKSGLGFQGGLGAELTLTGNLSLGLEIFGHHLNFTDWRGNSTTEYTTTAKNWTSREGSSPDIVTRGTLNDEGTLWYFQDRNFNHDLYVGDERSLPLLTMKREARIDLRALGIRLMLVWHFGRPL
jgi:opacity protein-like surface antigen